MYRGAVSSFAARWDLLLFVSSVFNVRNLVTVSFSTNTSALRGFSHFSVHGIVGTSRVLVVNHPDTLDAQHMSFYGSIFWLFSGVQHVISSGFNNQVPTTLFSLGCTLYELSNPSPESILSMIWAPKSSDSGGTDNTNRRDKTRRKGGSGNGTNTATAANNGTPPTVPTVDPANVAAMVSNLSETLKSFAAELASIKISCSFDGTTHTIVDMNSS